MPGKRWFCVRQQAGLLVKECRALRPRFSPDDDEHTNKRKNAMLKLQRSAVTRNTVDRLELMLALFELDGNHYTLTFDDLHLPPRFDGVRKAIRAFFGRAKRMRGGAAFDWIYAIEGLHGDHRYHVHMVLRGSDFPAETVRRLWKYGTVDDEPVLLPTGGYRRLARYFTKERTDGVWIPVGRHPWSCARSLKAKLPPLERWKDDTGSICIPDEVSWSDWEPVLNDFGVYVFASYILKR